MLPSILWCNCVRRSRAESDRITAGFLSQHIVLASSPVWSLDESVTYNETPALILLGASSVRRKWFGLAVKREESVEVKTHASREVVAFTHGKGREDKSVFGPVGMVNRIVTFYRVLGSHSTHMDSEMETA